LAFYKPVKLNWLQKRRFLVLRNCDRVADVEASEDEGFPSALLMGFHHQKRGRVTLGFNLQIHRFVVPDGKIDELASFLASAFFSPENKGAINSVKPQ